MTITKLLSSTALVCASVVAGAPAWAQTTTPSSGQAAQDAGVGTDDPATLQSEAEIESGESADTKDEIVVTGSRIRRPNLDSNIPITSIGGEEFFQQGQTNVGDTLNDLPQLRSTFAQQNPGAGVGIAGLNLLDLRGLGTSRTLVLVNGRRHVASDILNNAVSPDVNTIPNDLIQRVDIVTGGNSAVYGSDAIAGVVNFILRRDFNGIQIRGSGAVSEEGFGGNQYVSAMVGKNFADGRGNITGHVEYANQERIYASDIPNFRRSDGFFTADVDSPGTLNATDGFPDAIFVRDVRSSTLNRFGLVAVPQQNATAPCGRGTLANDGAPNNLGTAFSCNFIFDEAGNLVAQTGSRFGTGPAGTFLGGNGQTGREDTQLSFLPSNERFNTNLLARFEFSPAVEAFLEAKFVRINATGNQLGPTFLNNSSASLGNDIRLAPRLDNPFLNPAARATLASNILASGCGFSIGTALSGATCRTTPLTAAERAAIADGSYRFLFARNLTDSFDRDENFRRDTYRVVAGLRGTFNDDWNYEVSANYGRFEEKNDITGQVDRQRFFLSLDSGRNPTTGQIQCRSQFDPASARVAPNGVGTVLTDKLAADIAACVPYNPFGAGDNQAAVNYFAADITNRSRLEQLNFVGYVSGDVSQLFELPGGPIAFVLGGEYRREKAFNNSDDAADTGVTNGVFLGDVKAKPFVVKEAFGELRFPLLKDLPLIHELTFSAAGRVSDYNSAVGTVYAYNGGVEYAPIRDLRFRANYGRSVRAPNLSETSFPAVPNFANGFLDPCGINQIGNTAVRAANCQGDLTAAQLANLQPAGFSLGIISGSNANLFEETGDSYTVGGVFTPRFLPGFTLSVDYYDIRVKDVIATLSAQAIVNACYDTPGRNTPLCDAFTRNRSGANGAGGELPGQILNNTLIAGPQNFAKRIRKGVDVESAYRTNLGGDLRLDTRIIYSHAIQNSNFQSATDPTFENTLLGELGDPQDEFRWNVDVTKGPVTLGYQMRYIGKQFTSTRENFRAFPTGNPQIGEFPLNADAIDIEKYPDVVYHNVRLDFRVGPERDSKFLFYVGVDNLTDRQPPFGITGTGAGSSIYNIRGRSYFAGARARF